MTEDKKQKPQPEVRELTTGFALLSALLIFIAVLPWKGGLELPAGMPVGSVYNRKVGIYYFIQDGLETIFDKKGNKISTKELNPYGLPNGKFESFHYRTGKTISRGSFQNGERTGLWEWTFEDGTPYVQMAFVPGVRKRAFWVPLLEWGNETGPYLRYFSTGQVQEKGEFDGGNKTGEWLRRYRNSSIESKGMYKNDKKVGEWLYYNSSGEKEATEQYDQSGNLIRRTLFRPDGRIRCTQIGEEAPTCFPKS